MFINWILIAKQKRVKRSKSRGKNPLHDLNFKIHRVFVPKKKKKRKKEILSIILSYLQILKIKKKNQLSLKKKKKRGENNKIHRTELSRYGSILFAYHIVIAKKPPIIPKVHQNRSTPPYPWVLSRKNTSSTADEPNLIPFEVDHARIEQTGQSDVKLSPILWRDNLPSTPHSLWRRR